MKPLNLHHGTVAPLDRDNVDTDAIIPKQFLKSIQKQGFGAYVFDAWRFEDLGYFGKPAETRKPRADFVLNQPRYQGASILLTRKNFGCGSSREHAPWALEQYGFRVLIAESFADIFFNNCFKNGMLPITLPTEKIEQLFEEVEASPGYALDINLPESYLVTPSEEIIDFEVEGFRKACLMEGWDDIDLTLHHAEKIQLFEANRLSRQPWLYRMYSESSDD